METGFEGRMGSLDELLGKRKIGADEDVGIRSDLRFGGVFHGVMIYRGGNSVKCARRDSNPRLRF